MNCFHKNTSGNVLIQCLLAGIFLSVQADFGPDETFKEYKWSPGNKLRVGGSLDESGHGTTDFPFNNVDTVDAIKAEINVAKLLCHDDTRGLAVALNDNAWKIFPEGTKVPSPQYEYQHMTYPSVNIPLSELKSGTNNFNIRVDESIGWWPQNLIYGLILRVYYSSSKSHPTGKITTPVNGSTIDESVIITAEAQSTNSSVSRVEFIGLYEEFNYEGDGEYRQWHYVFYKGVLKYHLGTSESAPYSVTWKTDWVPRQSEPVKIMARIIDENGMVYTTPAVENPNLVKSTSTRVAMLKPYNIPKKWVTRKGTKSCSFDIENSEIISKAKAGRLIWVSWACNYMNGVGINDVELIKKDGAGSYSYFLHKVPITSEYIKNNINTGANSIYAAKPDESGVHGMEINWPAFVVKIQYESETTITTKDSDCLEPSSHTMRVINNKLYLPQGLSSGCISLFNIRGQKIFAQTLRGNPVELANLSSGFYRYLVIGADRNYRGTFIKNSVQVLID